MVDKKVIEYYKTHSATETIAKFDVTRSQLKTAYKKGKQSRISDEERKRRNVIYVSNKRRRLKLQAIEYLGSKCSVCGYDKCVGALEFHHTDPTQKEFAISRKGYTRAWSKVKEELDKCVLVCANCHREIHENDS